MTTDSDGTPVIEMVFRRPDADEIPDIDTAGVDEPECEAEARPASRPAAGFEDVGPFMICDLKPDHDGPFHYDPVDEVWWADAAEAARVN